MQPASWRRGMAVAVAVLGACVVAGGAADVAVSVHVRIAGAVTISPCFALNQ